MQLNDEVSEKLCSGVRMDDKFKEYELMFGFIYHPTSIVRHSVLIGSKNREMLKCFGEVK